MYLLYLIELFRAALDELCQLSAFEHVLGKLGKVDRDPCPRKVLFRKDGTNWQAN